MIAVPFNFFYKNPEYLKRAMVECWLPSLKSEKAQILARLKKTEENKNLIIRALLPIEFTNISNIEVLEQIEKASQENFRVEFCIGDERDDLILNIRLVSNESFEVHGEECSCGFSVVASDLGGSDLSIDSFLFRNSSKTSMIATYNGESFFQCDYTNIQPQELKDIFPKLVAHLKGQFPELKSKVQAARRLTHEKEDIKELMKNLRLRKGLSDKFHTMLFQEIEKDESVTNRWSFSNKVSIIAKNFDVSKRIKIEKIAGELVGLNFEKV